MKKALLIIISFIVAALVAEAGNFYKGMVKDVSKDQVVVSLTEIVRLFDKHAEEIGGAGFFYGVKSKVRSIFSDSHYDMLQNYVLRTPEYMLHASGISEEDPDLGKTFVAFCRIMPTIYDSYGSCSEKIRRSVTAIFPERSEKFHENVIGRIRREAGVDWLWGA